MLFPKVPYNKYGNDCTRNDPNGITDDIGGFIDVVAKCSVGARSNSSKAYMNHLFEKVQGENSFKLRSIHSFSRDVIQFSVGLPTIWADDDIDLVQKTVDRALAIHDVASVFHAHTKV